MRGDGGFVGIYGEVLAGAFVLGRKTERGLHGGLDDPEQPITTARRVLTDQSTPDPRIDTDDLPSRQPDRQRLAGPDTPPPFLPRGFLFTSQEPTREPAERVSERAVDSSGEIERPRCDSGGGDRVARADGLVQEDLAEREEWFRWDVN